RVAIALFTCAESLADRRRAGSPGGHHPRIGRMSRRGPWWRCAMVVMRIHHDRSDENIMGGFHGRRNQWFAVGRIVVAANLLKCANGLPAHVRLQRGELLQFVALDYVTVAETPHREEGKRRTEDKSSSVAVHDLGLHTGSATAMPPLPALFST